MKYIIILLSSFVSMSLFSATYTTVSPDIAEFLNTLAAQNGPPIYKLSPEKARDVLNSLQASSVGIIPAQIQDIKVIGKDKKPIDVRIVKPKSYVQGQLPVVLYVHGGGWILGNKDTHDYLIRSIANGANIAVVFVNYTPSPEAKFPVAIEQIYDVAQYVAQKGQSLGLNGKKMVIAGDSVGGNMATAVAQMAKDRGGPHFLAQILLYPVTDANFNTDSYREFGGGAYWVE